MNGGKPMLDSPLPAGADALARAGRHPLSDAHHLLQALPVAIYTTDTRGHVTFYNEAAVQFAGRQPVPGDQWCVTWKLFHPDGTPLPHDQCPMAVALRDGRPLRGAEAVAERPDGSRATFLAHPTPLRDATGELVGAVNMLVDVSELKRTELALHQLNETLEQRVTERTPLAEEAADELRRSERNFSLLVGSVTDYAIYMLDPEGRVSSWNAGAERIKGYGAGEIIGRHFSCFYIPEERAAGVPQAALASALRDGHYETESWRLRKGGARFWANVIIDPIFDHGTLVGFAKITRDVTEKRLLEGKLRQAQKMEAVGQLTGGIAHDFNNLLQGIIGSLDLIHWRIENDRTDELDRFVEAALRSAKRAAAMVHRLLAFSRRQPLDPRPVQANPLIASMEELLRRTMGEQITIQFELAPDLWTTRCDPNQLESALLNLAINARDAMPRGGELTIRSRNIDIGQAAPQAGVEQVQRRLVCIEVADTGVGMPAEAVEHAFEPFYTTKPLGQGTGLGLSMVYGFAHQSDGHCQIQSTPGEGTCVRMCLPQHDGALAEPTAPARPAIDRNGRGQVVLVVEDDPVVRSVVVDVLNRLGYRTEEAADGASGLDFLQSGMPIDLLVSDIGLPGLNGRQMAEMARIEQPELKVLLMTGYADDAAAAEGFLKPGMELITKPFDTEALVVRVQRMMSEA